MRLVPGPDTDCQVLFMKVFQSVSNFLDIIESPLVLGIGGYIRNTQNQNHRLEIPSQSCLDHCK